MFGVENLWKEQQSTEEGLSGQGKQEDPIAVKEGTSIQEDSY
jgi:hypothetical protein